MTQCFKLRVFCRFRVKQNMEDEMPGCDPGTVLVVLCDLNHCAFEFTAVSQLWRIAFLEPRRRDRLVCGACMVLLFHPFPSELCGT